MSERDAIKAINEFVADLSFEDFAKEIKQQVQ